MNIPADIVRRIRNRDESGLSMLYKQYTPSLYGVAYRLLGNQAFAEDTIQRSYLKIWDNIEQYDTGKATFFTWMAQIVKNTAIDIRRLKSFEKEAKTDSLDPLLHTEAKTYQEADGIDTANLLDGLDQKYAIVLDYLYLRGYSQSDLAKELDIPLGTIKTRANKAINILRSNLKDEKHLFIGVLLIVLLCMCKLLMS